MARMERIQQIIGTGEVLQGEAEARFWQDAREFDWATSGTVTKVPITPERIHNLEAQLSQNVMRRYSVGGNVAYVAAPFAHENFLSIQLLGDESRLNTPQQHAFAQRVKQAL